MQPECATHAPGEPGKDIMRNIFPVDANADADEEVACLDPVSRSVEIYNRWPGEEYLTMSEPVDPAHGDAPAEGVRWAM
jgi:hypothetical protein